MMKFEKYVNAIEFDYAVSIRHRINDEIVVISRIKEYVLPPTSQIHLHCLSYCCLDGGIFKSILGPSPSGVWVLSVIEESEFQTLKEFGIDDITSQVAEQSY